VPNTQATQTADKPVPTPKWFEAATVDATVDADKLPLFSFHEQHDFEYVLRTKISVAEDPNYVNILHVEGMIISHRKAEGESYVYIAVGDEMARAPFKIRKIGERTVMRTGDSLYNLARARRVCEAATR
jgi:hypothetical protein